MQIKAKNPDDYISQLPKDRQEAVQGLRDVFNANLPKGFDERMSYGMIGWVVPHELYKKGYHVDPKLPLPFINLASQKNYVAVYHSGIYSSPELYEWFTEEYKKRVKTKLDMGKSCIRLKKMEHIPFDLFEELAQKMTVDEWISTYESALG
jgi:uncharacterized protein YdhG (YjbR/CyaY superfamily)